MIQDEIKELVGPIVNDMGFELWGCEYLAQGIHSLLRIYIDKPEGITVDDCQEVSHRVSAMLDVEDPIHGNYNLEISSPGIPRPLFYSWQYDRFIGELVQIKTHKPIKGKRKFEGIIVSVSDSSVVLNRDGENQEVLFSNIVKANLTV